MRGMDPHEREYETLRRMTPAKKLEVLRSLIRQAYALKMAGIRVLHPELSEEEAWALTLRQVVEPTPRSVDRGGGDTLSDGSGVFGAAGRQIVIVGIEPLGQAELGRDDRVVGQAGGAVPLITQALRQRRCAFVEIQTVAAPEPVTLRQQAGEDRRMSGTGPAGRAPRVPG